MGHDFFLQLVDLLGLRTLVQVVLHQTSQLCSRFLSFVSCSTTPYNNRGLRVTEIMPPMTVYCFWQDRQLSNDTIPRNKIRLNLCYNIYANLPDQCYLNRMSNFDSLGMSSRNTVKWCNTVHCEHFTCTYVIRTVSCCDASMQANVLPYPFTLGLTYLFKFTWKEIGERPYNVNIVSKYWIK